MVAGGIAGSQASTITASEGDTLSSLAASLWGDASLWWKLAEANGYSEDATLTEGQIIRVPTGVVRSTYNASTFTPYDPAEIIGNVSPTTTKPPKNKKNGCGGLGVMLMVIVAIVVAAKLGPAALKFFANTLGWTAAPGTAATAAAAATAATTPSTAAYVAAGAVTGAASSAASQVVGMATGVQEKFSWSAVALAAVSGGVSARLGLTGLGPVSRAVAGSVITQGIGVATGLQRDFSWAGVAAAGVGAWVGSALPPSVSGEAARAVSNFASGLVNAAARSLSEGTDFGDTLIAALPEIIGQTIGNAVAGRIAGNGGGSGESIFNSIGDGLSAAADWLGFDGQFGHQDNPGRSFSLSNLGDAFMDAGGRIFASPSSTASSGAANWDSRVAGGMWIDAQDAGDWRPILPDPEHPYRDYPDDNMAEQAWRRLGIDPDTLDPRNLGDQDWEVVIVPDAALSPEALERARMRMAYAEALSDAADRNPGPHLGQLRVGEIPGTNFAGNGENDLANISYALAKAYGAESIVISRPDLGRFRIEVDSFIDPSSYGLYTAVAMDAMVQRYWSDVGYDPVHPERFDRFNDWANAVPTREVDVGAYHHDRDEIRFAGNPRMQMQVNRTLYDDANAAAVRDALRFNQNAVTWDLAIANFAVAAGVYQGAQPPNPQPPPVRPRR